ncbi:tetratricopeptide repeat protein [Aerococcaceae bacterium WGS1372]
MIVKEEVLNDLTIATTEAEQNIILINNIQKAIDNPKNLVILDELADSLFNRGQVSLAYTLMKEIYEINGTPKRALKILKRLYQYEEFDKAYYLWLDLAKTSNDNSEVRLCEARLLDKLDFKSEAIEVFKDIIKTDPTYAQAYKDLGDLLIDLGQNNEAERYFLAVYNYLFDFEDIREVRMKLVQLESWKEIFNLDRIKELENNPDLPVETEDEFYLFANVYTSLHQYERAIEYAKKALQKDKDNINYSLLLIELYNIVGQETNLVKELSHVAKSLPDLDPMIVKLAQVAYDSNYLSEEIIDKLMKYSSLIENHEEIYKVSNIVVDYYLGINDSAAALYKLNNIKEYFLEEEYLSYNYARIYQALNLYEKVEEFYQMALDYLLPEDNLVYDYVNFVYHNYHPNKAIRIANKYANTFYDNKKLKGLRKELIAREKDKLFDDNDIWE